MDKLLAMRKKLRKEQEGLQQKPEEKKESVNVESLGYGKVENDRTAQIQEAYKSVNEISEKTQQQPAGEQIANEKLGYQEDLAQSGQQAQNQQPKQVAEQPKQPQTQPIPFNSTSTFIQIVPSSPQKSHPIPQSTEQRKLSKVQMLREKMRLKKISQQENMSNKSIPQEKENEVRQEENKKREAKEQSLEKTQGEKKVHVDSVKEAVIFEGMREEHIPVEAMEEKLPIVEQPQLNVIQALEEPQEPQELQQPQINQPQQPSIPHTLFYQLKELKQFLDTQYSIKGQSQHQPSIKEFVQQLQRFKENIEICNRLK